MTSKKYFVRYKISSFFGLKKCSLSRRIRKSYGIIVLCIFFTAILSVAAVILLKNGSVLQQHSLNTSSGNIIGPEDCRKLRWKRRYKIKPEETYRLTAADVVGPDGIVYPNWTRVGVRGGIPDVPVIAKIEDFGGKANDEKDDSTALGKGCAFVGEKGGGALLLAEGTYYLDRPVTIYHDNVVIRGQGPDKTRLICRYNVPENTVSFFTPPLGAQIGLDTPLEMHTQPDNLIKMEMFIDDLKIGEWSNSPGAGNVFSLIRTCRSAFRNTKITKGPHTLRGLAHHHGGIKLTGEVPIFFDPEYVDTFPYPKSSAMITFAGSGPVGHAMKLTVDGKRGDKNISVERVDGLKTGDLIQVVGPDTDRWKRLTNNACKWGMYRVYQVAIDNIQGATIAINQPLRIEFPIIDVSYISKVAPIHRCGVEGIYLEQQTNLWISSILFSSACNCWARNVTVKNCGRMPIFGEDVKWCEIRNCLFDGARFKGPGGSGYAGWERAWDCLIDNIETRYFRHAPLFAWAASGNVIRKSIFHHSNCEWHAGWTNENLVEQCIIDASELTPNATYGNAMWASPPDDFEHGPNGPRNVVYNCDIYSPKTAVWLGGMNENWIFAYNRFSVEEGPGFFIKEHSFDHVIKSNVVSLKDAKSPMLILASPDCIGVELISNLLYGGNGVFVRGASKASVMTGNRASHLGVTVPERPSPQESSIYEWQNRTTSK